MAYMKLEPGSPRHAAGWGMVQPWPLLESASFGTEGDPVGLHACTPVATARWICTPRMGPAPFPGQLTEQGPLVLLPFTI